MSQGHISMMRLSILGSTDVETRPSKTHCSVCCILASPRQGKCHQCLRWKYLASYDCRQGKQRLLDVAVNESGVDPALAFGACGSLLGLQCLYIPSPLQLLLSRLCAHPCTLLSFCQCQVESTHAGMPGCKIIQRTPSAWQTIQGWRWHFFLSLRLGQFGWLLLI